MNKPTDHVWTRHATPLGPMILAASEAGLLGAWFEDQRHFSGPQAHWVRATDHALLREAGQQLEAWFARQRSRFDLPLAPVGTPFQQQVWRALARIDFGATQAYGQVARAIGRPEASRAVGAATGRNPWSIIVPCHRLLGQGGALTGYAGGLHRKQALLAFEGPEATPLPWAHAAEPATGAAPQRYSATTSATTPSLTTGMATTGPSPSGERGASCGTPLA